LDVAVFRLLKLGWTSAIPEWNRQNSSLLSWIGLEEIICWMFSYKLFSSLWLLPVESRKHWLLKVSWTKADKDCIIQNSWQDCNIQNVWRNCELVTELKGGGRQNLRKRYLFVHYKKHQKVRTVLFSVIVQWVMVISYQCFGTTIGPNCLGLIGRPETELPGSNPCNNVEPRI
jgi:hypothetical protein